MFIFGSFIYLHPIRNVGNYVMNQTGVVAQLVRASVCGTEGRGFESRPPPKVNYQKASPFGEAFFYCVCGGDFGILQIFGILGFWDFGILGFWDFGILGLGGF